MWAAVAAAVGLALVYREAVASYLRDQHYQEHFLYLWVFLGLALWRTLRPPFRRRFGFASGRDRVGVGVALTAVLLLAASETAGSNTGTRTSLALALTGMAILVVSAWSLKRCLGHGLLLLACFGLPHAVWAPITTHLQWGVASAVALPARLGLANYVVDGTVVRFPHYDLTITPDCSGIGQLTTFLGIATLGILASARNLRRTATLLLLAVALAWLSNLARVTTFVGCIALGWTKAVDDATWHAGLGFAVFLPFVTALVWRTLKTHQPLQLDGTSAPAPGRWPVLSLVAALVVVHLVAARSSEAEIAEPAWFAALEHVPGHRLISRAPTEASDRIAYETPWLVNGRHEDAEGNQFDLFHYTTRSRSHLCVHKVAACIGHRQTARYGPPVDVDGRRWWTIDLETPRDEDATHVYFAFEIGGQRRDDSSSTQFEVFRQRLTGASWEVRLTRVTFPGRLPPTPGAHAQSVLAWLGKLTNSSS